MSFDLTRYLYITHTPNGREYPFLDCWGLVYEFYRHEYHITLNDYTDFSIERGYAEETSRNGFYEISPADALEGDIIAFFRKGIIFHVAIYLGNGRMLHTGLNNNCRINKVRSMQFVECKYYRFADR